MRMNFQTRVTGTTYQEILDKADAEVDRFRGNATVSEVFLPGGIFPSSFDANGTATIYMADVVVQIQNA